MIDSKDNEIIELANILVNLSNVSEQKLKRTTTIEGAEALMILQSSQPKNTTKTLKNNCFKLKIKQNLSAINIILIKNINKLL